MYEENIVRISTYKKVPLNLQSTSQTSPGDLTIIRY